MYLASDDADAQSRNAAFLQGLQELGWAVGRNVRIDYRWGASNFDPERMIRAAIRIFTGKRALWSADGRLLHCATSGTNKLVWHPLLEMPDYRCLAPRERDRQRLARGRLELANIGPVVLRAIDLIYTATRTWYAGGR
jgi:hypothetical protein